jgi:hypothetical protein
MIENLHIFNDFIPPKNIRKPDGLCRPAILLTFYRCLQPTLYPFQEETSSFDMIYA